MRKNVDHDFIKTFRIIHLNFLQKTSSLIKYSLELITCSWKTLFISSIRGSPLI